MLAIILVEDIVDRLVLYRHIVPLCLQPLFNLVH